MIVIQGELVNRQEPITCDACGKREFLVSFTLKKVILECTNCHQKMGFSQKELWQRDE